jgi:hypothetical protein
MQLIAIFSFSKSAPAVCSNIRTVKEEMKTNFALEA